MQAENNNRVDQPARILYAFIVYSMAYGITVVRTKSDSDLMFCLHLLSKTLTSTPHLS